MISNALAELANDLQIAGLSATPTVVLSREVPVFEVEFAALEFAEESRLPACDWAVLALAKALGQVTAANADSYLGLGETVSEGLLGRLRNSALLEGQDKAGGETAVIPSLLGSFFGRLLGVLATDVARAARQASSTRTQARKLHESAASNRPSHVLSAAGIQALERGAILQRRVRPARLLFLADPLLYLETVDERRHKYSQHRRLPPIEPDMVPRPLRELDAYLALAPEQRLDECGIHQNLKGFSGQLVGIVPGSQWEVRQVVLGQRHRPSNGRQAGSDRQTAQVVLAACPSADQGGLSWKAFVRHHDRVLEIPTVLGSRLLPDQLGNVADVLKLASESGIEGTSSLNLRTDGALDIRCSAESLARLHGDADLPADNYLASAAGEEWTLGLRVHPRPVDSRSASESYLEFLSRHEAELKRDFDSTCARVALQLGSYWEEEHHFPSPDDVAQHFWQKPGLRAALCQRRLQQDLIAPYEDRS